MGLAFVLPEQAGMWHFNIDLTMRPFCISFNGTGLPGAPIHFKEEGDMHTPDL
jgi:hypothetical protein